MAIGSPGTTGGPWRALHMRVSFYHEAATSRRGIGRNPGKISMRIGSAVSSAAKMSKEEQDHACRDAARQVSDDAGPLVPWVIDGGAPKDPGDNQRNRAGSNRDSRRARAPLSWSGRTWGLR